MPRRRIAAQREILPDPKYKSELISRFINTLMKDGKKSIAERLSYEMLAGVSAYLQQNKNKKMTDVEASDTQARDKKRIKEHLEESVDFFCRAVENISPNVEVRARRVGGSTYQIPVEVRPSRRLALSFRWLIDSANRRSEKTMAQRLVHEVIDAFNNRGMAVKKREDTHRMAKANQAYAHFGWS